MKQSNTNYRLIIILLIFGILYASISIVNHYLFRTYAFDLGLFNNALYDYARFQNNEITLALPNIRPYFLGDHFSLYVILFAPLNWILGSFTMIVVQIASILAGGIGIYRYILHKTHNTNIASTATISFLGMWGIFSALAFDYHDNVVAAMLVPWLFLYVSKEKFFKASIFILLILISKENIALWTIFICLGLAVQYRKSIKTRNFLLIAMLVSTLYFLTVIKLIIPYFNGENGGYYHFGFNALGSDFVEVFKTIITKPIKALQLLIINNTSDPSLNGIKTELWIVVLLSGGFALIRKPYFLIMLLPIFAQKLFNDDPLKWGINYHYSIEFAPILCIAAFSLFGETIIKRKELIAYLFTFLTLATTIRVLDTRKSIWYSGELARFYDKRHYTTEYDVRAIHAGLKLIDKKATISAQNMLVPHLANRDRIYHFPYIGDAQYVVLLPKAENKYPLNDDQYNANFESLKNDKRLKIIYNKEILIFERKK